MHLIARFLFCLSAMMVMAEEAEYHNHAAVTGKLQAWHKAFPKRTELIEIGSSAGGRTILVLKVAASGSLPPERRPAIFVGANMAGPHNAGTEAALHFIESLLGDTDRARATRTTRTVYIAPILNPDAHEAFFAEARYLRFGNDSPLDLDLDGLEAEDGVDDLDKNGFISQMRVADPAGGLVQDPDRPLILKKATKTERGQFRLLHEGDDNDKDGSFNEDGREGIFPDRNFAHAFPFTDRNAGPWASYAPESKAIMDFLLQRRHIALAVVFGPANNLLAMPEGSGKKVDLSKHRFKPTAYQAASIGLDRGKTYLLDEIWDIAKDNDFIRKNNLGKDDLLRMLSLGPVTHINDDDRKHLDFFAEHYRQGLEAHDLDAKRPGRQYQPGGFTPWLYYHFGTFALELDVWGLPSYKNEGLTIEKLGKMDKEAFLALDDADLDRLLDHKPALSAARLKERVSADELTPKKVAGMLGKPEQDPKHLLNLRRLQFAEKHAPAAMVPWKKHSLADGTEVEIGGFDPFLDYNPPKALLAGPMEHHTRMIYLLGEHMAEVKILETRVHALGAGVFRIEATAGNQGYLPTHTSQARRAQVRLPVRLGIEPGSKVEVLNGPKWATAQQLHGREGVLKGEWLVKAAKGTELTLQLLTEQAGRDTRTIKLTEGRNQ